MWSWSHTQDAYDNARENLSQLDEETLRIIWAEWRTFEECTQKYGEDSQGDARFVSSDEEFDEKVYVKFLEEDKKIPLDILVDEIWSRAEEQADCDNGGFNAYLCPYACSEHMVSCDLEEESEDELE